MKNVYLVHDQQASPAGRQNLLEMAGYRVHLMKGGRDLAVALREAEPDLLVLDVLIEGKNGFEVVHDVSAKHRRRRFPIMLCSRIYRSRQFREEALRCGADEVVLLPAKPEAFLDRVTKMLANFRPLSPDPIEADVEAEPEPADEAA